MRAEREFAGAAAPAAGLTRSIGLVGAVGIAVAGMAPTLAMNLNPQGPAEHVGRAVPLVFASATVAIALVAWCFARLAQRYAHAGSCYAFAGVTLGPRVGLIAGWSLLGAYLAFTGTLTTGFGIFAASLLRATGIWPTASADVLVVVGAVLALALSLRSAVSVTRALLVIEGIAIVAMLALAVVVFAQVGSGDGVPLGELFDPADGVGLAAVALAMSFGLLSFAGFEQAATLGEDARDPRRTIPIALIGTILIGGAVFTVVSAAEVIGIIDDGGGIDAFTSSSGLLQDLGDRYVATWAGDLFELFAAVSALGGMLGLVIAASRLGFAFSRDLAPTLPTARLSPSGEAPRGAIVAVVATGAGIYALCRVVADASASDVFFWASTAGVLLILIPYLLMAVGAFALLVRAPGRARIEALVPLAAAVPLSYTLWANLYPPGDGAFAVIPWVAVGWLAPTVLLAATRPALVARVRDGLLRQAG